MSLPEITPNTKHLKSPRAGENSKRKQTVYRFIWIILREKWKKKIGYSFLFKAILFTQSIAVVFQTNVSWNKSDTNVPSNSTETISVQNDNVRRGGMETEICVSIKDATFAWPNSKTPVLVVDDLKIEEGVLFNFFLPQITRLYNLNVSTTGVQLKTKQ